MKNFYKYISILAVFGFLVFYPAKQMPAQEKPDFHSELYHEAIQNIVINSNGKLTFEDVLLKLESPEKPPPITQGILEDFALDPEIQLITFDDTSADFYYSPTNTTDITATYTGDWVTGYDVDNVNYSITFTTLPNETPVPRSSVVTVTGTVNAVPQTATGYILQEPADETYIFISPQFIAMPPEEGVTGSVSVTAINFTDWVADIPDDSWVSVENQLDDEITFHVTENDEGDVRQETIPIHKEDDPTINDILTIYQYVNSSEYIIATPSSLFSASAGGTFEVEVNANIPWIVSEDNPAADWITDTIIGENAESVSFVISENTGTTSLSAQISLIGTDNPDVEAQIDIEQAGSAPPYIIVTPQTSNVGPNAGSLSLKVDANVSWTAGALDDPDGMLSNFQFLNDSVKFDISANDTPETLTASGWVYDPQDNITSDTFHIIQNAAYILLNPREILAPCEGDFYMVDITRYKVDEIEVNTTGYLWNVTIYENDSLQIEVTENTNLFPVSDTLIVRSASNSAIRDTLTIFQYACNQPYIVVSPKFQTVPYQGDTTGNYQINSSLVEAWEVHFENPVTWITETIIDENDLKFVATENNTNQPQQVTFQIRSVSDTTIFDTAVIFQDGAPNPVLIASPREQLVSHTGNDSVDFQITYQNISGWEVDPNSIDPTWITVDSAGGNLLSLDILENTTTASRENQLVIFASNDDQVRDTVSIYQYSANEKYILAAPRERIVESSGSDSTGFMVITANVETWLVDSAAFPDWISLRHKNDSSFSLITQANQSISSRSETIIVYDSTDTNIYDSVQLFQYLGEEPVILVSPREQISYQSGGFSDPFSVETTGLDEWSVTEKPDWVNVIQQGGIVLLVDIEPNPDLETRVGTVYVGDPGIPDVFDSVKIYQFSTFDSYLLAQPRQKSFGQSGAESTIFEITKANVLNWETLDENLPEWIQVNEDGGDILDLKVLENPTYETRHDSVFIFSDDNNGAADTVFIYQYAANDTILLASPRQQISSFTGEILDFEITVQNAEAWKVDPESVPGWINIESQGGNLLSLATLLNHSSDTRFTTINIFDTLNPDVNDLVAIYQYAAPQSYILAAPRSDTVQFFGDDFVTFEITSVNLSGDLTVDENTVPQWITAALDENQLQLYVDPNPLSETRNTIIYLHDSDSTEIRDSILIFQYAQPEKYILAAPREQQIGYEAGNLFFTVTTTANVNSWIVDETTVTEWITNFDITPVSLSLDIGRNNSPETRFASIRIYDIDDESVEDSIQVYQYSDLDHYILAEPREQQTSNLADTLTFIITSVNLEPDTVWQWSILQGESMVEILSSGRDSLTVSILSNPDSESRNASIRLFSESHPSANDTVRIYQYSAFEPYIILEESHNIDIPPEGETLPIVVYSNLDTVFVEKGSAGDWYNFLGENDLLLRNDTLVFENFTDTIALKVEENTQGYLARSGFLRIFSASADSTETNFYFQQSINPDSSNYIISGNIYLEGDTTQPFADSVVTFYIGADSLGKTLSDNGFYADTVPFGWVGSIKPEKENYFFEPANWVIEENLTKDTTINFGIFEIKPEIFFNIEDDTIPICFGEQIDLSSPEYPTFSVTGTFGQRQYYWYSDPPDENLPDDTTNVPAYVTFAPDETTTYFLKLFNSGKTDSTSFTIEVNPPPEPLDFNGSTNVCRNQAGVIYSVMDFEPGEYFQWKLSQNGDVIRNYNSNIVTINWNIQPGEYELTLYTLNSFGCSSSQSKTITVSNEEAPREAVVSKKSVDNMLVCSAENPENLNFAWGWYNMSGGNLGEKYIIPDRNEWYCRLPDGHTFDPLNYSYFVQLTFKDGSACETISFLNGNAPLSIEEAAMQPFTIFPNPTSGSVWIKFNEKISGNVMISLRDLTGQIVAEEIKNPGFGSDMILIESTKQLQQGVYFMEVRFEEMRFNTKIVVQ